METNAASTDVQVANALERRLDLMLPIADLDKDVDQRLKRMSKGVKMPGFRPGKVPASIVRQQYGEQARHEALNEALDRAFGEAVQVQQLRIAGYPKIEPKASESATHVAFSAVFEVYPEVSLGDLSAVEIERPVLEVGAAELDRTIEILRKQRVKYEPVERAAAKGDRVLIDFLGKKGGEPFAGGQANDYPFVLGEGAMLPDFENAIEGCTPGASKSFEMTFPEDYHAKDMAGQTVSFDITVKEVRESVLPEVDAEFARTLGVEDGDLVKMRLEIETNLRREVKKRLQAKIKDQVMEAVL